MGDKFELLESKVKQVLQQMESLKTDNTELKQENKQLRSDLKKIKSDFNELKLVHNDQADLIKTKLLSVLSRIEELEKIGL
jgi:peptidoglycan hydrolase CwlO-like protein